MNTAFRPAITACVPVLALALLLPVSCVSPAAPAASIPPEIAQKAGGWPAANQGYDNTRCAAASSIDSGNVRTLGVLWSVPVAGLAKGNPIIADEVVYYQDFMRNVFAVDIYGNIRWQRKYDSPSPGPTGVAVGWGKVFAPAGLNEVVALDISDG